MAISLRMKKFYDEKRMFSITKRAKLSELASIDAFSIEQIPELTGDKRKFATEQLSIAADAMVTFESMASECAIIQNVIMEISRYSSYLDQLVPYKSIRNNKRIVTTRNALCKQRTMFCESLVNDDMMSTRTVNSAMAVFTEVTNFDSFLRSFGEYICGVNLQPGEEDLISTADYKEALFNSRPGALMALVLGSDEGSVINEQVKILNDLKNQNKRFTVVETENNVLCWSLSRSFLDLPSRILDKAGTNMRDILERMRRQLTSTENLKYPVDAEPGINYLAEWSTIICNGLLTVAEITRIFVTLLDATLKCTWEFFFLQLEELSRIDELEVLESVLSMCQENLFKETAK